MKILMQELIDRKPLISGAFRFPPCGTGAVEVGKLLG